MLLESLTICSEVFDVRKRRVVQAAKGAQNWVTWSHANSANDCVLAAKKAGYQIVVVELTSQSVIPESFVPVFPVCLVLGGEMTGVSQSIVNYADAAIAIPMHGMANSLNLSTAAAIVLYEICKFSPISL
jgi:tRNA (guanosine-2'-O-)-methyltransferase